MSDTAFTKGKSTHGGKGSAPRPIPDQATFADNWDRIFNNNKDVKDASDNETTER